MSHISRSIWKAVWTVFLVWILCVVYSSLHFGDGIDIRKLLSRRINSSVYPGMDHSDVFMLHSIILHFRSANNRDRYFANDMSHTIAYQLNYNYAFLLITNDKLDWFDSSKFSRAFSVICIILIPHRNFLFSTHFCCFLLFFIRIH